MKKRKAYSYIRFSTPEQAEEEKIQKQLENTRLYVESREDLILDESLTFRDLGKSAKDNLHAKEGEFGKFLQSIGDTIEKGSVLIVENLDRLSRDSIDVALTQFMNIIRSGIDIVTLQDRKEYTKKSLKNPTDLIISITIMSRAHEENETKRTRIKEKWVVKREIMDEKILTRVCPDWLKYDEKTKKFILVDKRAKYALNRIFDLKIEEGLGAAGIESKLNDEKVFKPIPLKKNGEPNKRTTSVWRKSYINKILRNPAVYGEYQPCETVYVYSEKTEKKAKVRVPIGDPNPKYFPEVVPKEKFDRVKEIFKFNRESGAGRGGGRNGKYLNVFKNIVKCGNCNKASMNYDGKGEYSYLRCYNSGSSVDLCDSMTIRYDIFAPMILQLIQKLDPNDVIPKDSQKQTRIISLRNRLSEIDGALIGLEKQINNLVDKLELGEEIVARYNTRKDEKKEYEKEREEINKEMHTLENLAVSTKKRLKDITELIEKIADADGKEAKDIRIKLNQRLRRLIESIKITSIPDYKKIEDKDERKKAKKASLYPHLKRAKRKIEINFRDGLSLSVLLDENENLIFATDEQTGQSVRYWVDNGVVTDVDINSKEAEERTKKLNKKVQKRFSRQK